ncbi:MAG: 4-hydroxythreonine-4-phosphate dehydrogenase PdxA [Alphaproteobacteria bacterium]|nr:4-hydroxythreonine-4-phosphate dehydrogenase PdxA [Alphaproteobacteria bacterium]
MTGRLVVTMGDPAGIGAEIIIKSRWQMNAGDGQNITPFYVLGDVAYFNALAQSLNFPLDIVPIENPQQTEAAFAQGLPVLDLSKLDLQVFPAKIMRGTPNVGNGKNTYLLIKKAVEHINHGDATALVTAPIAKEICQQAGFQFSGHTDYLAHLNGKSQVVMMLANQYVKAVPLTVHIPLKIVPQMLTPDVIITQAKITHRALQQYFAIEQPILAMAGLNPHAGEGGMLGDEEQKIIIPALQILRAQNIDIRGPFAGDSLFSPEMRQHYDVALACYHDQALIAVKALDMAGGVNITLGLDFIRTSPDHGTAFDIADNLTASPASMLASLKMASVAGSV